MPEEIAVLRCTACDRLDPGPRLICPGCGSTDLAIQSVPGRGTLVTWTEIRRPPAGMDADGPYKVAVVALAAGVQVTGRLRGAGEPGAALNCVEAGPPPIFEGAENG